MLFRMLPADLDFRFHAAIAEGAEYTFVGQTPFDSWSREKEWRTGFVTELLAAYPDRNVLCDALVARLKTVKSVGMSVFPAAQLVNRMINADPRIGATIIESRSRIPIRYCASTSATQWERCSKLSQIRVVQ